MGAPGAWLGGVVEIRRRQGDSGGDRGDPGPEGGGGLAHGLPDLLPLQGVESRVD